MDRVGEILRLHHIVLLIAPEAMLGAERGAEVEAHGRQSIEAVGEVAGHRGGVREQRDALAFERPAKSRVGEQPVDSEQGHCG